VHVTAVLGDLHRIRRLFLATARELVALPGRASAWHWSMFVVLAALVVGGWVTKRPVQVAIATTIDGRAPRAAAALANELGGGFAVCAMGVASWVVGRVARATWAIEGAIVLAAGGMWCFALTTLGQFILAEARPVDGGAMAFFAGGGHGVSGHASAAALLATTYAWVAGRRWPRWRRVIAIVFGAWVLLVAWSRVWLGAHYAWNVMLGLALGWVTARAALRAFLRTAI
jgi:membrane-associated phospholipid phosphatase